jgi:hypothetical protein
MKSPLQSVKTVIHESYTLSAVVSITYESDTCPSTYSQYKNTPDTSLELVPS